MTKLGRLLPKVKPALGMPRQIDAGLLAGMLAVISISAAFADDMAPPVGYRQWFHVNTMVVDKASPLFKDLGGMHTSTSIRWVKTLSRRVVPIPTGPCS